MDNSTYSTKLLHEIQSGLGLQDLLFRTEATHLVERPTPLTFSILSGIFSYQGSIGQAYKALDLPLTEYEVSHYLRYLGGRIYLELHCEDKFLNNAMGMEYKLDGDKPILSKRKGFIWGIPSTFRNMVSNSFILSQYSLHVSFAKEQIEQLKGLSQISKNTDLKTLQETLLIELQQFYTEYSSVIRLAYLEGLLAKGVSAETFNGLTSHNNADDLYVTSSKIWLTNALSLEEILQKFGNRSFNDFEFSAPRWSETPEVISTLLNKATKSTNTSENSVNNDSSFPAQKQLQELIILKDNLRFYLLNRVNSIRQSILRLGKELNLNEDIFFLSLDDITHEAGIHLIEQSKEQKEKFELEKNLFLPELITKETVISTESKTDLTTLAATPVSVGSVEGKFSIVATPSDTLQPGTILILPTAGPEYTHLYATALGIVFQSGGVLSHGSIIAREMHIPAVVAQFQENSYTSIRLDATAGLITFLTTP